MRGEAATKHRQTHSSGFNLRDRVRCHFVAIRVKILHLAIIGPLVRNIERGRYRTAVRILTAVLEQIGVQRSVQIVHRIVERQQNDLRRLFDRDSTYVHDVSHTCISNDWLRGYRVACNIVESLEISPNASHSRVYVHLRTSAATLIRIARSTSRRGKKRSAVNHRCLIKNETQRVRDTRENLWQILPDDLCEVCGCTIHSATQEQLAMAVFNGLRTDRPRRDIIIVARRASFIPRALI